MSQQLITRARHRESRRPTPRAVILALLCTTQFMIILDAAIVNVALPSIQRSLHLGSSGLAWVLDAYMLAFGGFLLLGGRMADGLGRRRMFLAGLALFAAASLGCGLAHSAPMLVSARAVQGLGSALASPAALALLTVSFPAGPERARAMGAWGGVAGAGGAVGVLLGGVLTDLLSWPWIFLVNVPVGAAVVVLARRYLPADPPAHAAGREFDLPGAATVTGGVTLLVFALLNAAGHGWTATGTLAAAAGAAALLAAAVAVERNATKPVVPARLLARPGVAGANAVGLLLGAVALSTFFLLSLYLQQVPHYSPLRAGAATLASSVSVCAAAAAARPLLPRLGLFPVLFTGLALSLLGRLWFTQLPVRGHYPVSLLPGLVLAGSGLGLAFVAVTVAAVSGVDAAHAGVAAGLINTSQQVGAALGVAVASTLMTARTHGYLAAHAGRPQALPHALVSGLDTAFVAAAVVTTGALLVAGTMLRPGAATPRPAGFRKQPTSGTGPEGVPGQPEREVAALATDG